MTGEIQPPVTEEATATHTSPPDAEETGTRGRLARTAATAGSPKLRAVALVLSVATLLVTIVCAPFGALPWWSPILMLVVSGGVFYWCRASAMAAAAASEHRGARTARPAPRQASAGHARRSASAERPGAAMLPKHKNATPLPLSKATTPTREPVRAPAPAARTVAPRAVVEEQVFDVRAGVPAPAAVPQRRAPVAVSADAEDAWQPVAVPAPTYTMKERAPQRPQQAPAATSDPKSYEHVANEDLPFDGLALDQDLDDLPSVFRAG